LHTVPESAPRSRTITEEVEKIFYFESRFRICRRGLGGLSGLFSLRPIALSWISSLCIRLNICDCSYVPTVCDSRDHFIHDDICHRLCVRGYEELLRRPRLRSEVKAVQRMVEWKQLCHRLAASITPNQLGLCVICDVADIETAKEIIEPLSKLPVLRECTLRLGMGPCQEWLQYLVMATVLEMTRQSSEATRSPFPFLDLPAEIQILVLRHADLVSPYQIAWYPDENRVVQARYIIWHFSWQPIGAYEYRCCWKCSDVTENCCCSANHTAYSTTCTCWRMPVELFCLPWS
jgi:hypothetical protein